MEFFATCAGGLEGLLADELARLGCGRVRPLKGQVSFEGTLAEAYRACLWSRIASRVVVVLARVAADDSDTLYASLRELPWADHVPLGASLAVDAHGTNDELRNTRFVALRAKDALADTLFSARGARPIVDVDHPDLTVVVRISRTRAAVGIDLAGEPLLYRGYGVGPARGSGLTSLRADYAGALVTMAWEGQREDPASTEELPSVLTLFPGSGSLLVEAACAILDRAPGLLHQRWGMVGWSGHDARAWDELLSEARSRADAAATTDLALYALDSRQGSREACAHLLRAAGIGQSVSFVEAGAVPPEVGLALGDLSWLGSAGPAEQAAALGDLATAVHAPRSCRLVALAPDGLADRPVGEEPTRGLRVQLGRDEQALSLFELKEGRTDLARVSLGDGSDPSDHAGGTEVAVLVPASDQFAARLSKMARERASWAREEDVSCYRVYDADLPDYAVTIDLFEGIPFRGRAGRRWLSIYEYAAPREVEPALARSRLIDVLALAPRILGVDPRDVFVRTRTRGRGGSQYADEASPETERPSRSRRGRSRGQDLPPGAHLVDEGGLTFEVNFSQRLDCGLFLDHRDTRAMLREMAKGMGGNGRFLNLFAYTGTGTCYAADGGARATTTVDLSRPSLEWARRNMERNGFSGREHEYVQADVFRWVRDQRKGRNRWDLVFCDVPTFSNSSRMSKSSFDVQRDHVELLIGVSRLLTKPDEAHGWQGGTCVFSCNLRRFKPDVERLARAGVTIEDITASTIPHDFARNPRVHHCFLVRRSPEAKAGGDRPARSGQSNRPNRSDRSNRPDPSKRPNRIDRSSRPNQSNRLRQTNRSDRPNRPNRPNQSNRPDRS